MISDLSSRSLGFSAKFVLLGVVDIRYNLLHVLAVCLMKHSLHLLLAVTTAASMKAIISIRSPKPLIIQRLEKPSGIILRFQSEASLDAFDLQSFIAMRRNQHLISLRIRRQQVYSGLLQRITYVHRYILVCPNEYIKR